MNIDWETIEFEFSEEFDLLYEIYNEYQQSYQEYLKEIKSLLEQDDFHKAMVVSHTLKGVVSNFYCEELISLASQMEELCKEKKTSLVFPILDQYQRIHHEFDQQFEIFFKKKLSIKEAS